MRGFRPPSTTLNAAGTSGENALYGGTGADCIVGGTGGGYIIPGAGSETITGGAGSNNYLLFAGSAPRIDTITDFNATRDLIGLFGYAASVPAAAFAAAVTSGGNTTVTLPDSTSIVFLGVTNLSAANII